MTFLKNFSIHFELPNYIPVYVNSYMGTTILR